MSRNSTPTHALHQTLVSHVNFAMTPSRSSTTTMAAVPWWTEHSPNLQTSGWKLRSQDIDSLWKNVMTLCYVGIGSTKKTSPTTTPLSKLADSWLMPEALHALDLPCLPSSSPIEPLPTSPQNHPNLCPCHLEPQSQLIFPGSLLANGLLTGPLPLPYRMKMDSSSSVYPCLMIQVLRRTALVDLTGSMDQVDPERPICSR